MNMNLQVSKRNGVTEPLDLDKIHRVVTWAAEGLRAAGQPSPLWTPLEFFVLWHLER